MPISKPDFNLIFASQAPSQDLPAAFNNYARGWDEARKNNGKPTIKQFNYLIQQLDLKALWMIQNGAALPFDETVDYAEGAFTLKDRELQQFVGGVWKPFKKDVAASDVKDESGLSQQQLNDNILNEINSIKSLKNKLDPRNFGVVGDGVTDDSDAIDQLLEYMRSIAKVDNRGFNLQGRGVDFSGLTCMVSRSISLLGFSNYTFISPAFTAAPNFTGDSLLLMGKYTAGQWQINNITFVNPYFDCNWVCDHAVNMTDYVKVKIFGGYIYRYRKKGIRSVKGAANCHELNLVGTFIFQTEAGEDYPLDITEGEAYYIDSPDNNFSNVVIGPQKVAVGTATGGPTHFSNCHFYAGGLKKIYGSTSDHFVGCYFDGVELVLGSRSTILGNLFVVNEGGFALTFPMDNFAIRVTDNQFRKLGTNASIINYPTMASGRNSFRPAVSGNSFANCPAFQTYGREWITGTSSASVTFTIPNQYLPISSHAFVGWTDQAGNAGAGDMFITTELTSSNTLTVRAYKVNASGALLPQALTGRSLYVAFSV